MEMQYDAMFKLLKLHPEIFHKIEEIKNTLANIININFWRTLFKRQLLIEEREKFRKEHKGSDPPQSKINLILSCLRIRRSDYLYDFQRDRMDRKCLLEFFTSNVIGSNVQKSESYVHSSYIPNRIITPHDYEDREKYKNIKSHKHTVKSSKKQSSMVY